jgi:hypothetical protein
MTRRLLTPHFRLRRNRPKLERVLQNNLSEENLRAVFAALVKAQDEGTAVSDSHNLVAQHLGVKLEVVQVAESLGLENSWPPLS